MNSSIFFSFLDHQLHLLNTFINGSLSAKNVNPYPYVDFCRNHSTVLKKKMKIKFILLEEIKF